MTPASPGAVAHLRLSLSDELSIGPGKARLLEAIEETGSIAAAGRQLAMSYKRAWTLVEELNRAFREPLVTSARGGSTGGGASLTPTGRMVLATYRRIEARAEAAVAGDIAALRSLLAQASCETGEDGVEK
ncbi:winged helix-turn-helix domain-containing protein [Jiella mangrovi]|uniref:Winged helix-turn-helix domain-containing protein n=1 Tax=Jiella mangrovi TaxID=2821407 RepID=A0ABS4BDM0_9HYPH|nr:winged helix-turn-helix domain-containing protein [Jiella mangrovi]MBP0614164.1 winged helix-turn-helix domain-containing protein [Jiella mangrovi]